MGDLVIRWNIVPFIIKVLHIHRLRYLKQRLVIGNIRCRQPCSGISELKPCLPSILVRMGSCRNSIQYALSLIVVRCPSLYSFPPSSIRIRNALNLTLDPPLIQVSPCLNPCTLSSLPGCERAIFVTACITACSTGCVTFSGRPVLDASVACAEVNGVPGFHPGSCALFCKFRVCPCEVPVCLKVLDA